jgi:hypothetical protein
MYFSKKKKKILKNKHLTENKNKKEPKKLNSVFQLLIFSRDTEVPF